VDKPELREFDPGHQVACHFPITEFLGTKPIVGPDPGLTEPGQSDVNPTGETNGDDDLIRQIGTNYDVGPDTPIDPGGAVWR
jgi:hypothetical protein